MCCMKYFWQNCLSLLLVNAVPGSVRIFLGMPLSAMYRSRNSITLFVVGARINFTSGQPVLLSIKTINYFLELRAFLNGSAKSMATSSFVSFGTGIFPKYFCVKIGFIELPIVLTIGCVRGGPNVTIF